MLQNDFGADASQTLGSPQYPHPFPQPWPQPWPDSGPPGEPVQDPFDRPDNWLKTSFEHDKKARFILGSDNVLRLANIRGRELLEAGKLSLGRTGGFRFAATRSQGSFDETLRAAHAAPARWHYKVMRLMDDEWCAMHILVIAQPLAYVEIVIQHVSSKAQQDIAPIADAFGLTAMEAKVLLGLTHASCPKSIANSNHISVHTVRAHIRGIFAKMGTHNIAATQSFVLALVS